MLQSQIIIITQSFYTNLKVTWDYFAHQNLPGVLC